MLAKTELRRKAVSLRRQGKTYGEIRALVPVAKSTLSIWLRDVGLALKQKQRITRKRIEAQLRGAAVRKEDRMQRESRLICAGYKEIGRVSLRELKLIGAALYWAEGSKAKPHRVSVGLDFSNSDPAMVRVYVQWLVRVLRVPLDCILMTLYIHETSRSRLQQVIAHWNKKLEDQGVHISAVYLKKHKLATNRKNIGQDYYGTVRVKVKRSTELARKVRGWIYGISN